jgi:hypothetical protein
MITLLIKESLAGQNVIDVDGLVAEMTLSTNEHGFAALEANIRISFQEAFRLYNQPGMLYVAVADNGYPIWEGRLEDVSLENDQLKLKAFGYQRAFSDVPYTGLITTSNTGEWIPVLTTQISNRNPDMFVFDTNNRLFVGLKKNAAYGAATNQVGGIRYERPSGSDRQITHCSFAYEHNLPTQFTAALNRNNSSFSGGAQLWSSAGTGSVVSGTQDLNFTADDQLEFYIYNNSGSTYTHSGEDGTSYLMITNLLVRTNQYYQAQDIANVLLQFVSGINASQINNTASFLQTTGVNLTEEIYEDVYPAAILDYLVELGDNQTLPRQWEWGVWEGRNLHFRPRGTNARTWYVDAGALRVNRSIDLLRNSVYAVYREARGRTLRTAISADTYSVSRYGITRRASVSSDTTSNAQATTYRDAYLQDKKTPIPGVQIAFDSIYDGNGMRWPLYWVRAGDTIIIRNLIPALSTDVDRIRSFRIIETRYDAIADTLSVTPESPPSTVDWLLVREKAGVAT